MTKEDSLLNRNSLLLDPDERDLFNQILEADLEESDEDHSDNLSILQDPLSEEYIDRYIKFIKLLEAESGILKERANTFQKRTRNVEARISFLKEQICILVNQAGTVSKTGTKFVQGEMFKVTRIITTSKQVNVEDLEPNCIEFKVTAMVKTKNEALMLRDSLENAVVESVPIKDQVDVIVKDLAERAKRTETIVTKSGVTVIPSSYPRFS